MSRNKDLILVSKSPQIEAIFKRLDKVVATSSSVLLVGETGVGKELFAEYVHRTSNRTERPFVKISLSALPAELLESELFGHEKGSYTSAHAEKKGLFEIASSGSIFLDDIDDVPLPIQTKLLRVLESGELMRVGGTRPIPIDVRLITASKIDLHILVDKGTFRRDLFYRINVVPVYIPPLRERLSDIRPLLNHFFHIYAPESDFTITEEAMESLRAYSWPGNVRELKNVAQRLALFSSSRIERSDLPPEVAGVKKTNLIVKACDRCFLEHEMSFDNVVACLEKNLLKEALEKHGGNQTQAAKSLQMSLSTFRDKMKKYEIDCHQFQNN